MLKFSLDVSDFDLTLKPHCHYIMITILNYEWVANPRIERYRSASSAAMHPEPAAVTA